MKEILDQALSIGRGMWKFRWPGVAVAWVVAAIAAVVLFRIPDQYEASARIYVDTQSILKPLMAGLTVQPPVEQQIGMLSRTLISRPNVEKLVRMADLDLAASTKSQQDALVDGLMKTLQIGGTGRDNLYTLVFRDSDPDKAKRVVQSLLSIFVESSLGASRKDTDSAKVFLDEQIKGYERLLEESETRLKTFRLRNVELQGADGKDSASRLAEFSEALKRSQLELREAENARDAARAQIDVERKQTTNVISRSLLQESSISVATPELDGRIEGQRRSLDALLTRFTEQHPDVVVTRRLVAELEEQRRKQMVELRKSALASAAAAPGATQTSPAEQEMSRVAATSEVLVASLRARVAEFSSRLVQAREAMKLAPQLEAEAAQLNRDYGILKTNYETLVARRQSAEMSGRLESAAGVADFRLIDPPRVSPKPVSPNRLALAPLVLLAGLGAGLAIAFGLSQLRPMTFTASDLRHKTGLPVLGVVTLVMSEAEQRAVRMDLLRFVVASGGLVGVFIAGMIGLTLMAR